MGLHLRAKLLANENLHIRAGAVGPRVDGSHLIRFCCHFPPRLLLFDLFPIFFFYPRFFVTGVFCSTTYIIIINKTEKENGLRNENPVTKKNYENFRKSSMITSLSSKKMRTHAICTFIDLVLNSRSRPITRENII